MKNILESVCLHACVAITMLGASSSAMALDHRGIVSDKASADGFVLISDSKPVSVCVDDRDDKGVRIAASNLSEDFGRVCGTRAPLSDIVKAERIVIVGTLGTPVIDRLVAEGKLDGSQLKGHREKYVMTMVKIRLTVWARLWS